MNTIRAFFPKNQRHFISLLKKKLLRKSAKMCDKSKKPKKYYNSYKLR